MLVAQSGYQIGYKSQYAGGKGVYGVCNGQIGLMLVCGNSLSIGMKGEIAHATKLGIPISVFSRKLYLEVCEAVKASGGVAENVMHDMLHPVLSLSAKQLFDSGYIKSEGNVCYASLNG